MLTGDAKTSIDRSTVYADQVTIAGNDSVATVESGAPVFLKRGVLIQNSNVNSNPVYVGVNHRPVTSDMHPSLVRYLQAYPLENQPWQGGVIELLPGAREFFPCRELNDIVVDGTPGDLVNRIAW